MFHKETHKLCNTDENGQPKNAFLETVGCVYNRYRLVHRWVPEMVLNVQSDSLIGYIQDCKTIFYDKTNKIFIFSLFLVSYAEPFRLYVSRISRASCKITLWVMRYSRCT